MAERINPCMVTLRVCVTDPIQCTTSRFVPMTHPGELMVSLLQQPGHVMTSVRPHHWVVNCVSPPLVSSDLTQLVCCLMPDHFRTGNRRYGGPSHAGISELAGGSWPN